MDGTIAALFFAASLTDMVFNDCRSEGCLAPADERGRLSLGGGDVVFQSNIVGSEAYLRYDFAQRRGPFQPSVGLSVSDKGDTWVGIGAVYNIPIEHNRIYGQLSLLPGLYQRDNGPDLGHEIEFRSALEIGYEARSGMRVGLNYDHRSNFDFGSINPGLETLQIRVSFPVK